MSYKYPPKRWVGNDFDEEFFGDERKLAKRERKIASAKDRSKYKKTDQDKQPKPAVKTTGENDKRGRVISIVPEGIIVDCEGVRYTCTLRGVLKKEKSQLKNLVTVGDYVLFEPLQEM